MTKSEFKYFKRDISWLSFNYRVLLEAKNEDIPIYERVKFLAIYSSNLEEFYKIRVSGYHSSIIHSIKRDEPIEEALKILKQINDEVKKQEKEYHDIFDNMILPELRRNNIYLYQSEKVESFHKEFVETYFNEEVFPFLQPMMIQKNKINSFIQGGRIYQVISMIDKSEKKKSSDKSRYDYAIMKIPYTRLPRFIELPFHDGMHYIMFIDDIIKANLSTIFYGYEIVDCYSIKISRDADFSLDEEEEESNIAENILEKVRKRKIGAVTRLQYDKEMPGYFLKYICETYGIQQEELLPSGRYLNLAELMSLPNPVGKSLKLNLPSPLRIPELEENNSLLSVVRNQDVLLHFPYESFDYLLRFLMQAAFDPKVLEIKVTQYRVAENSAVINTLITAAKNGKKVTVFVEMKARFDEENNYITSERMHDAGIKIIYSLPGLKVHAKLAYIRKRAKDPNALKGYAYLSTGNFNEKTARIYSDKGLLTSNPEFLSDIEEIFDILEGKPRTREFKHLLVAQFNMVPEIYNMIKREVEHVQKGETARIILKMNSLEDKGMINALYNASLAGVEIDLIIRGICCLIPNQPYSKNIRITRIVDSYLEHSRVWYFYNGGAEDVYLTSADWMERNLHRRIEAAFPILSEKLKKEVIDILKIQLEDNLSAVWIDEHLNNVPKKNEGAPVRAQQACYEYLKQLKK